MLYLVAIFPFELSLKCRIKNFLFCGLRVDTRSPRVAACDMRATTFMQTVVNLF